MQFKKFFPDDEENGFNGVLAAISRELIEVGVLTVTESPRSF